MDKIETHVQNRHVYLWYTINLGESYAEISVLDEQIRKVYPKLERLTVRQVRDENSNRNCIKAPTFQALES